MVLQELRDKLASPIKRFYATEQFDDAAVKQLLSEVTNTLLRADMSVKQVQSLRTSILSLVDERIVSVSEAQRQDVGWQKKIVVQCIADGLCQMLSVERKPFEPIRGQTNIIMFVGLQGSGKTTTCTKLAQYYKRKGFNPGVVCADTFRAGAYDQLKQNCAKVKVRFYGSTEEKDPVQIAREGVEQCKERQHDLIIVDTSGRHKQEGSLLAEMAEIRDAVNPQGIIYVVDSHIGQGCYDQAKAFADIVDVGSVILTKMDGHAKGGGALAAVSATGAPITFVGTGEHFHELEKFNTQGFVSELLGMGDIGGLIAELGESISGNAKTEETIKNLMEGRFSYTDLSTHMEMMSGMNMGKMLSKLPGAPADLITKDMEEEGMVKMRKICVIIKSMTRDEREGQIRLCDSRIRRLAIGSGTTIVDVQMVIQQHKLMADMVGKMNNIFSGNGGGLGDMIKAFNPGGKMPPGGPNPSQMNNMMKMLGGNGGPAGRAPPGMPPMPPGGGSLSDMMKMFGGGNGGPPGGPDLGDLMKMFGPGGKPPGR